MRTTDILDDTFATWAEQRPDLDFDSMELFLKMGAVVRAVSEAVRPGFDELGITLAEFDVLATLRRRGIDTPLTPSHIAEVAMVKPSGLSHRLNRLESAGLVIRTPDEDDRRSFRISITPAGRDVIDRAIDILVSAANEMLGAHSDRQRQSLHSMLDALVERIDS